MFSAQRTLTATTTMLGLTICLSLYAFTHGYQADNNFAYLQIMLVVPLVLFIISQPPALVIRLLALSAVVLLAMLVLTHFQAPINGSRRWLTLAGLTLQPSEFLKLALPCLMLEMRQAGLRTRAALIATATTIGIAAQPDLGTASFVGFASAFVLLNGRRLPFKVTSAMGLLLGSLYLAFPWLQPYQQRRLLAWLDPDAASAASVYQIYQSQTVFFQEQQHNFGTCANWFYAIETDFIWTLYACQYGWQAIALLLIAMFALTTALLYRLTKGLRQAIIRLATGIVLAYAGCSLYTLLMAMGLMPVIGLPTPMLSYGGSQLMVAACGLALVGSIAIRHR